MSKILHIKSYKNQEGHTTKGFTCCDKRPELKDIISNSNKKDTILETETVLKECKSCKSEYIEETIFGHQNQGYPVIKTYKKG